MHGHTWQLPPSPHMDWRSFRRPRGQRRGHLLLRSLRAVSHTHREILAAFSASPCAPSDRGVVILRTLLSQRPLPARMWEQSKICSAMGCQSMNWLHSGTIGGLWLPLPPAPGPAAAAPPLLGNLPEHHACCIKPT